MRDIPQRMRTLERDKRGYPIPVIVLRDKRNRPHFTINDHTMVRHVARKKLCSICGDKIRDGFWFIGGPMSHCHMRGAFIDPPMHDECAHFAIEVCPYLAMSAYKRRVDARTLRPEDTPDTALILTDPTMIPERPAMFGLGKSTGYDITSTGSLRPIRPYSVLEWWRSGSRLTDAEARTILKGLNL